MRLLLSLDSWSANLGPSLPSKRCQTRGNLVAPPNYPLGEKGPHTVCTIHPEPSRLTQRGHPLRPARQKTVNGGADNEERVLV